LLISSNGILYFSEKIKILSNYGNYGKKIREIYLLTVAKGPSSMLQPLHGFQLTVGGHQAMAEPGFFSDGGKRFALAGGTSDTASCELN
jgi:hypothetical protein